MDLLEINKNLSELLCSDNGCEYSDILDGEVDKITLLQNLNINVLHINIRSFHKNADQLVLLLKHYRELFIKIGKNAKLMWNVINGLLKKVNNKSEIVEICHNGRTCTGKEDICNVFNNHFASVGKHIQNSVNDSENDDKVCGSKIGHLSNVPNVKTNLKFVRVMEMQICKIVERLKPKTSHSVDGISNILLKRLISVIKTPLCTIFNRSLKEGIFPDLMKLARVIPLFKCGNMTLSRQL